MGGAVAGKDGVPLPSRGSWRQRVLVVLTALATLAVFAPVPAAEAVTITTTSSDRVLGDLTVDRLQIRINGRTVRGDLLHLPDGAPDLELRPRLAQGTAVGLETMTSLSRTERSRGAVAGINGGYWVPRPTGVPNGLYVERGRMVAADSSLRSGLPAGRAVAGFRQDGSLVADRIRVHQHLDIPSMGIEGLEIDELNRQVRTSGDLTHEVDGELLLFDTRYGPAFHVPGGSVLLVVDDLELASSGRVTGVVRERRTPTSDGRWQPPEGTSALLAYGTAIPKLTGIDPGMEIGVTTTVAPFNGAAGDWDSLRSAVPGAGLLVREGSISSGALMSSEGVNHASLQRARTAVGQKPDGTTVLLTIDETGGSSGVTLFELAQIMSAMGVRNAVAMDGGGSTAMTINGYLRNSPSHVSRGHSSAWFVYAPRPPASRGVEAACPSGSVPSGAFEDISATVHAAAIDCLAWWQVTGGVTATRYAPAQGVTRDQMASFLVRWMDGAAERGDVAPLPTSTSHPFTDVGSDNVHAAAIARLSSAEIIRGRTETTYDPRAVVTRAETATLLRRALEHLQGSQLPPGRDTFTDDNASVHEPSINQLSQLQIVGGTGGFSYVPNDPVSRAAMASMVMRASDWLVSEGRTTPPS